MPQPNWKCRYDTNQTTPFSKLEKKKNTAGKEAWILIFRLYQQLRPRGLATRWFKRWFETGLEIKLEKENKTLREENKRLKAGKTETWEELQDEEGRGISLQS